MKNARILVDFLRKAKEENDWDMSDECLTTSEPVLKRIENALSRTKFENSPYVPPQQQYQDPAPAFTEDFIPSRYGAEAGFGDEISQWSVEILFPELFSEFTDTAMLSTQRHQTP